MYLLVAATVHMVTALAASWRKRNAIMKAPFGSGLLLMTSIAACAFVAVHVKTFRFGPGIEDG